ncbi:RagB/SusD family nutrient uptake outer membrane protein [Mucilaginibacter sp. NFX135]|uniref:RagB/SusD family nutrient uptake outer membrane protein n=1 Tax=Mucilaginibacter sp. NFX135 TaxID=3402687 RepID=UPI003AFB78C9
MKNLFITLIILGSLASSGCKKDFLDRAPLDSYTNTVLWKSSNDVLAALNGCYSKWGGGNNGYYGVFADNNSDNTFDQFPWENWLALSAGIATPTNPGYTKWQSTYTCIQTCNWFLDNVGAANMDATLKARTIGEARFLRAYEYFMLSQLYGAVPLVEHNLTTDEANKVTQASKADVVKFVLNELTAIAPNLPVSYSGSDLGRITQGAAIALKARIELFNQMYPECIADCQKLMTAPFTYSIYPSYVNLFRQPFADNQEVILDVQFKPSDNNFGWARNMTINSLGGYNSIAPTQSLVDAYETTNGKTIDDPASGYNPAQPYQNRDPRLSATVFYPGAQYSSKLPYGFYYDPISSNPKTLDHWGDNNCSPSAYGLRKYTPFIADFPNLDQVGMNVILIRYAEIKLMDAEAKIESNKIDASVYDDINAIRKRAGVNMPAVDQSKYNDQASLRTLLRRERRVELAVEGLRWFDIQRWQIGQQVMNGQVTGSLLGTVNQATGAVTLTPGTTIKVGAARVFDPAKNYLWPIPQTEIDLNKSLKQNPGY